MHPPRLPTGQEQEPKRRHVFTLRCNRKLWATFRKALRFDGRTANATLLLWIEDYIQRRRDRPTIPDEPTPGNS